MICYLYDETFLSLLTLLASLYKLNIEPSDIKAKSKYVKDLFTEAKELKIENSNTLEFMIKVFSFKIINTVYIVFLSDNENKEMIIYDFLKQCLKYKDKVFYYRNIYSVEQVLKIRKYVLGEAHRLKGFLRFKEMKNNFYYAEINPTNDCLEFITPHFQKRLSNEIWIIKDINRNKYAIYDLKKVYFLDDEEVKKLNLDFSKDEEIVEDLWKTFFKTIAIKERKNKRCQRNFMPKKYWDYIIEMEDEV